MAREIYVETDEEVRPDALASLKGCSIRTIAQRSRRVPVQADSTYYEDWIEPFDGRLGVLAGNGPGECRAANFRNSPATSVFSLAAFMRPRDLFRWIIARA
jgi:hypothetical protein